MEVVSAGAIREWRVGSAANPQTHNLAVLPAIPMEGTMVDVLP